MTREKLKALLEEYGRVAIWTYFVIWIAVLAGFALAISAGVSVSSASSSAGVLGAAWLAAKLTQPLRIAGTLAITPLVAAALKKWRRTPADPPAVPAADPPAVPAAVPEAPPREP